LSFLRITILVQKGQSVFFVDQCFSQRGFVLAIIPQLLGRPGLKYIAQFLVVLVIEVLVNGVHVIGVTWGLKDT